MSETKERLARIKKEIEQIDTYYIQSKDTLGRELLEGLNDQCDIDWLIEQAERVEELEKTLKFYANNDLYYYANKNEAWDSAIFEDEGNLARKALERESE